MNLLRRAVYIFFALPKGCEGFVWLIFNYEAICKEAQPSLEVLMLVSIPFENCKHKQSSVESSADT